MKNALKKMIYCLPVLVVLLTILFTAPTAQAAAQLKKPSLKTPVNTVSGVKVRWGKVSGAQKYRVYVKTGSSSWKKLADTTATSYLHKRVTSGATYSYTVRCITKKGSHASAYNKTGKTITYLKAPAISSFANTSKGPRISWSACKGATKYQVFIKTSTTWKLLGTTTSTSYLHTKAKNNTSYSYRVRSVGKNNKVVSAAGSARTNKYRYAIYTNYQFAAAVYTAIGKPITAPDQPTATLTRRSMASILVQALEYEPRLTLSFKDSADVNLRTVTAYGYLKPDSANRILPTRQIMIDEYESIIKDVNRYALYHGKRLLTFGDSIMVGYGNNNYGDGRLIAEKFGMEYLTYAQNGATFSTASNNCKHISDQIKVAQLSGSKADIILLNGGTNDLRLVAQNYGTERFNSKKPAASNFAKGFEYSMKLIRQYWPNVPVIYIRDHNMAFCSDALERQMGSYGLTIAKKYSAYTVDLYTSSGLNTEKATYRNRYTMHKSALKGGDSIHPNALGYALYYLRLISDRMVFTPTVNPPVNTVGGVSISWKSVGDSPKYRVFVKSGSSWVKLADTTKTSYLHQTAVSGTKYTYTVRCLAADGKTFTSSYDSAGKSITYVEAPTLNLTNTVNGVQLSWSASRGAAQYRVMIHNGSAWINLADTAGTSYEYTDVVPEAEYTFTVRCLSSNGKSYVSAAAVQGRITYIEAPQIAGVTDETDGAKLIWNASAGAAQYRVLVRNNNSWERLADTDDTFYTHDADHDTTYCYSVCCIDADGNIISGYDTEGYEHHYFIPATLDSPVIKGFENTEDGMRISWDAVASAERYRMLVKSGGHWTVAGETDETSFLYTGIASGTSVTCTVCCVTADGKAYTSAYDTTGKTYTYFKAPVISITNTANGLLLKLEECAKAASCRIYLKNGEGYTKVGDTIESTYLYYPVASGAEYTFTACYLDALGNEIGPLHAEGCTARYTPDPDKTVYTAKMFADDVNGKLGSTVITPASPKAALSRRIFSELLCKALGYTNLTKGITLIDTDNNALKTAVFLGYLIPNLSNRIYPDALITEVEYQSLMTEIDRYTKLKGKTVLAFGDSIMYGDGNNNYGFARILSLKYGMKYVNYSQCGATMSTVNNGRLHIPDQIKKARDAGCKADVIFLNGGTNDLIMIRNGNTPDTFDTAHPENSAFAKGFESAMTMIRNSWGSTPVLYVRSHNMNVCSDTLEQKLGEYGLAIANKYHADTVDIYSGTDLDTAVAAMRDRYTKYRSDLSHSDGIHPNYLGYSTYYLPLISEKLSAVMIN